MKEFTPLEYLKMDIAARFGLDKQSWTDRQIWTELNFDVLESLEPDAKEPAQYRAAVMALRDTMKGIPTGFGVSLDGTASGTQLLAAMSHDESAAYLCNLLGDTCKDFYTEAYGVMKQLDPSLHVTREEAKQAVMTSFYSSQATPKRIFGEEKLGVFYEALEQVAPSVMALNEYFLGLTDKRAIEYSWTMPDNHDVIVPVMVKVKVPFTFAGIQSELIKEVNQPTNYDRSLPANITHSVEAFIARELLRRTNGLPKECKLDVPQVELDLNVQLLWELYEQSGFLSSKIFQYLTKYNKRYVDEEVISEYKEKFSKKSFPVLTTHDCFKCHPNNANEMRKIYQELFKELINSDMASFIIEQITGKKPDFDITKDLIGKEIGEYVIC